MTILTIGISDGLRVIRHENGMWYGQIRNDDKYSKEFMDWIIVTIPYKTAGGARQRLIKTLEDKVQDIAYGDKP